MAGEEVGPGFTAEAIVPAEEKAAAARAGRWPTLAALYGAAELESDRTRTLVSLEDLPAWLPRHEDDKGHTNGHGIGPELNRALGGGIAPGVIIGVGAAAAKSGKTAFIHQLADGLALRSARLLMESVDGPLTPLVILSEMDGRSLTWRSLARWTGFHASHFRAGQSAAQWANYDGTMWRVAEEALSVGLLAEARKLTRIARGVGSGAELVAELAALVADLKREHPGREVWPIVMVDPIQRYAGPGGSATEAMDDFASRLNDTARGEGWCVLLTSDATKATATGAARDGKTSAEEEGAAVFRGSYTLQHILDAAFYLRPAADRPERLDGVRELEAVTVFNRWGGGGLPALFDFHGATMRLYARGSAERQKNEPRTRGAQVIEAPVRGRVSK